MQTETLHTEILQVTGMTCGGCVNMLTRALVAIDGVHDVQVSLALAEATVLYDEQFTSPDKLKLAVHQAGYGIKDAMTDDNFKVRGCCC